MGDNGQDTADHRPGRYVETHGDRDVVVYRSSELGMCERRLALYATNTPVAPPEWLQKKFDEGTNAEAGILASYYKIKQLSSWRFNNQTEIDWEVLPGIVVRCHFDAYDELNKRLVEAKFLATSGYEKIVKEGVGAIPYYAWQVSNYMWATGAEVCDFVVAEKVDHGDRGMEIGRIHIESITVPPIDKRTIREKVLRVEKLVNGGGALQAPCSSKDYPCPFVYLHDDEEAEGPLTIDQTKRIADVVYRYKLVQWAIEQENKALDAVKKELKEIMEGLERVKAKGEKDGKKWSVTRVVKHMPEKVVKAHVQDYYMVKMDKEKDDE